MKLDMAPDPISKGDGGSNIPLFVIPKRKGRHGSALFQVPPSKQFVHLHRVERRALAKIVADAPTAKAVVHRACFRPAADRHRTVTDPPPRRHNSTAHAPLTHPHPPTHNKH